MSKVINMNFKERERHLSSSLAKKMANILLFVTLILWKEKNIICLVIFLAQYPQHVNSFLSKSFLVSVCRITPNYHFKWFSNMVTTSI